MAAHKNPGLAPRFLCLLLVLFILFQPAQRARAATEPSGPGIPSMRSAGLPFPSPIAMIDISHGIDNLARDMAKCAPDDPGCRARAIPYFTFCVASSLTGCGRYNPIAVFRCIGTLAGLEVPLITLAIDLAAAPYEGPNPWCNGGSGCILKCCKYTPDQSVCTTAFCEPAPINCEGAKVFNPTLDPKSFGPFLFGLRNGCPYPECPAGEWPDSLPTDYTSNMARRQGALEGIGRASLPDNTGDPNHPGNDPGMPDFMSFVGCRGWFDILSKAYPFAEVSNPSSDVLPGTAAYERALAGCGKMALKHEFHLRAPGEHVLEGPVVWG
jgi:hypothetical protein